MHKVISLPGEVKRQEDVRSEFFREGVPFEFFNAIVGKNLNIENYKNEHSPYHRQLTLGEVGCYLSHIENIRSFVESDIEYLVTYEDDIRLSNGYKNHLNSILQDIDSCEFDILLLGYRNTYLSFWGAKNIGACKLKRFCDYGWGAHAYLVTRCSARKILNDFSSPPLIPFDCITGGYVRKFDIWKQINYKIYATPMKLVELNHLNSNVSTITDRVNASHRFNSKFLSHSVKLIKQCLPIVSY